MSAWFNLKMLGSAALALGISTVSLWPEMASANIVFDFTGTCDSPNTGCPTNSSTATAVLTLADAYVYGAVVMAADFVSFSYSSGDQSFDIKPANVTNIFGGFNSDGSFNAQGHFFLVGAEGTFLAETNFLAASAGFVDAGSTFAFTNVSPPPSPVPEPSTWAMMLIGFAGLGYASRRASHKSAALAA
jgi:PEP-CTERM motif